jgi:DNA recombination protein RmuC
LTEVLLAAGAGLVVALLLGWALWARPLAATRAERDAARADAAAHAAEAARQREERGRNATEVAMLTRRNEELAAAERQREALNAELRALQAQQAERDRAHAAEVARTAATFDMLAKKALEDAQASFLERATARFDEHSKQSATGLQALLQPVTETLGRYEGELKKVEAARAEAYGELKGTVELVRSGQESVRVEAARLVNALRASPKARGRWGEQQLRNVLEMAGLAEHADFATEVSVAGEDGRLRPDVIVRLPGGRQLVIDAKCSMNAYLDACEATDDLARGAHLLAHAKALRGHADSLGRKAYWDQFAGAADYVLMFIPGEQFLSGALEADAGLWEYAFEKKVLLATPTNLVAIARTVAVVWRQEQMAEHAKIIAEMAREMYKRLATMGGHIEKMGANLNTAVGSFNAFVGSLETSVMPQGRKFAELSVDTGAKQLPMLEPVETAVRAARRDRDLSFDEEAAE